VEEDKPISILPSLAQAIHTRYGYFDWNFSQSFDAQNGIGLSVVGFPMFESCDKFGNFHRIHAGHQFELYYFKLLKNIIKRWPIAIVQRQTVSNQFCSHWNDSVRNVRRQSSCISRTATLKGRMDFGNTGSPMINSYKIIPNEKMSLS
jgi:hypothetical protein